ncbi:hypothetical protein AAVH_33371 [Aphelenchoides avenae]|nr:hypothetical protein AAVH_33371 [Aphelenchus avenae]
MASFQIPVNAPEAVQELKSRVETYKSLAEGRELTIQQLTAVTVRDHQTKQRLEAELGHLQVEMDELQAQYEKLEDDVTDLKFRVQQLMTRLKQKDNLDSYRLQIQELEQEIKEKDSTIGDLRRQLANVRNQLLQERLATTPDLASHSTSTHYRQANLQHSHKNHVIHLNFH